MTGNELKAREIAENNRITYYEGEIGWGAKDSTSEDECYDSAIEMAKWKDEQFFKKAHRWIEKIAPLTGYSTYDMIEDFDEAMEE